MLRPLPRASRLSQQQGYRLRPFMSWWTVLGVLVLLFGLGALTDVQAGLWGSPLDTEPEKQSEALTGTGLPQWRRGAGVTVAEQCAVFAHGQLSVASSATSHTMSVFPSAFIWDGHSLTPVMSAAVVSQHYSAQSCTNAVSGQ